MADFRPAEESDYDQIVQIIRTAFVGTAQRLGLTMENCPVHPSFYTRERLSADQAKGRWFYVLEMDGEVVGCVYARRACGDGWEVGRLAVSPSMHGMGLGEILMDGAEQVVRAGGGKRINIDAFSELTGLVKWYQRLGYVLDAVENIEVVPRPVAKMHKDLVEGYQCSDSSTASTCA